MATYLAVVL